MEEAVMIQELSHKFSDIPFVTKPRSISAVCHLPPRSGWSPICKDSYSCGQPQPLDVSATPCELDEELEEGEIPPEEMPLHEGQNCKSSHKAGAAIEEGHEEEPLVAEGQSGKSLLETDDVSDQWWMKSKVYPPPKRRSVSAIHRYPQSCGRDLGFTVANFDSKRVQCEKINGMNEAVLRKDGEAILYGVRGTNGNSKDVGEAGVIGCMNKESDDTNLARDLDNRDVSHSMMVKGAETAALEEKTKDRDVERPNGDYKVSSCVERETFKGKGDSVDKNCTSDTTHNKVVNPIKVKIRCKKKNEEASKTIVLVIKSPSEKAKERTCSNNQLSIKKSPLKVISKKRVGIKCPVSKYNPSFPRIDRRESGDVDLEEYGSRAILQSQSFPSRVTAKKSALYRRALSDMKHHQRVAKKNIPEQRANSSGPNGPKKDDKLADPRAKVKRCLRLFQIISRQLLQEVESGKKLPDMERNRIDLRTARIMGERKETLNRDEPVVGAVPGVEVGDEYRYRAELSVLGLHRPPQAGIDSMVWNGIRIATSIVASGGYSDDMENENVLIYTGAGGKPTGKPGHTEAEDQKLERGNLALKNSIDTKTPVRVIHGQNTGSSGKVIMTFTYDGLYMVERYWRDKETYMVKGEPKTAAVFRFRLKRLEGQPELNWSKLKRVQNSKVREGLCSKDISLGQEKLPICVINTTIDNENPEQFQYITKTVFPSWYQKTRPKGCKCNGPCYDSNTCSCAAKNGGQIPFNFDGAIVMAKPLIYECGPMCGCPPSCYNRASQHGIKFPLEVFKTGRRGWGVCSLSSIPSGSFVCEYIGELLRDQEADKKKNDEYLFDIGHNYDDSALWEGLSSDVSSIAIRWPSTDKGASSSEGDEQEGYTIDALEMGNVGRFINHSCSPNLYAQNVLFDHDDKKMPHIMFFAAENIPPLMELTYHYNYSIGAVRDSDGNVKTKECYCGASECKGRLY